MGWKGLINDPHLNGSFEIEEGLHIARRLLIDLAEIGLPLATEALDPISPQYLQDLISWSAIGARTTESQTHREMSSGLSCAVGFKNGTDGSLSVAVNAMKSVSHPHNFLGIDPDGHVATVRTAGNQYGHVVLRGGDGKLAADGVAIQSGRGTRPHDFAATGRSPQPARCSRRGRWSKEDRPMGIKLDVSVETPLSDDDRDILAGISVMVLAIANRQNLADQPHMQEEEEGEPLPCGAQSPSDPARFCVRVVAHHGHVCQCEIHLRGGIDRTAPSRGSPVIRRDVSYKETVDNTHVARSAPI